MSVCIDNSKFLSKTVTKRIYVRDILIDIPKAGQATNEPLVPGPGEDMHQNTK